MVDYKTNSLNLYLNSSYTYSPRLQLFATLTFSQSKAELDQVIMPSITERLYNDFIGGTDLTHQDFSFDEMHEYSNLDYRLLGLSLGLEYEISAGLTWTADGQYYDLIDDQGYVYGDESGSLFIIRTGFNYDL
nr:hypothetical protein [candidate division Zixibacteria bacterium]